MVVTFTSKLKFLRRVFGSSEIDRQQKNAIFTCPSCGIGTKKKKFYINLDTWQCHCWSCGLKGKTILPILRKYGSQSDIDQFLKYTGSKEKIVSNTVEEVEEEVKLPEGFILLSDHLRSIDPDTKACLRYLSSRGLGVKDLWRYRLGTVKSGRLKRRIVVPSFDAFGDLNFFVTRAIDSSVRRKYINSTNNKKLIVFNEIDIDWSKELVLTEGPFDMMKAGENATCILGSSLRDDYLLFQKIVSNKASVLLALDSDMKEKEHKMAADLSSYGCQVRTMNLEKFSDVGEMTCEQFSQLRKKSTPWDPSQRLKVKIGKLRSGSLL
jgi:DNA primase